MARYIDAVQCADIISEKLNIPLGDLVDMFAEIPTADVVEVVRCKDCKHFDTYFIECESEYGKHHIHTENDFCSDGERRDT